MFRLGTLFLFTTIVFGQGPERTAYVSFEATGTGEVHSSLTLPAANVPAWLPLAFAQAVGCGAQGLEKSEYTPRVSVRCAGSRPSALTFHAAIQLGDLAPLLAAAGVTRMELTAVAPHFRSLRLDPALSARGAGYYHAQYAVAELPAAITIDGGFEISQVRALVVAAAALILSPLLLLILRPSDPLRLRAWTEGIFVFGWIAWVWVLLHEQAGALLGYVCGRWAIGSLLALLIPSLAAVWIGSRLGAANYARLTPNGLGADDYRRMRFWPGAGIACIASTILNLMLSTFTKPLLSLAVGAGLAACCLLVIRRIGRGGSHALSEGDLRKRIFGLAAKGGVALKGVSILTSPTPRPPAAFATRWGVVFLNEALLRQLSRREVEAVVCHELSHLRPVKRSALMVVYVLMVVSILAAQWAPNFAEIVPVSLVILYFLFKAWRRAGERTADLDSVRWSGDPEAMITGLARVSQAHGMPLEWPKGVSWMMAHPSTMLRIRAIARAGGIDDARIADLIEESKRDAGDHYMEARAAPIPEDAAFSPELRRRMQTRLTWYGLVAPLVFGLPAVWALDRIGLEWWGVLSAGSLVSMVAIYVGYEWITGSARDAVKRRAIARYGQGTFVGFSPAAEPRVFDGLYHYDLGIVQFLGDGLTFSGDRARFTLDRRSVRRVWLGDGPRHWTPRKVVYIECRPSAESGPVIFSLQTLSAWVWPGTVRLAKKFYREVDEWQRGAVSSTEPAPCALPQVEGTANSTLYPGTAWRSVSIYCGIGFVVASLGGLPALSSSAVCGVLAFFLVWPRLSPIAGRASDRSPSPAAPARSPQ